MMADRLQIRRDTSANWSSSNPTLAQGELGVDTTVGRIKIGDGATAWNSLAWRTSNLGTGATEAAAGDHTHLVAGVSFTAADKLLGRSTAGAGTGEEITCTAAGRALIDDATAADQLITLGVYTATMTMTNKTLDSLTNLISADRIHRKVYAAENLAAGDLVYVSAWNVTNSCPEVLKARSNSSTTMPAIGMADAAITSGQVGEVYMLGIITGMNTNAYAPGTVIYVSSATAGAWTSTRPVGPNIEQKVAVIGRQHASLGTLSLLMGPTLAFSAADKYWYGGTNGVVTEGTITAAGRDLLDDAAASNQRTTLGLGTMATATASDYGALNGTNNWTAGQAGECTAISYASSVTLDFANSNNFIIGQLTGTLTLPNPSNIVAGQSGFIKITQHASSPTTITWSGSYWKFAGGTAPTLTATNGAVDIFSYVAITTTFILVTAIKDVK